MAQSIKEEYTDILRKSGKVGKLIADKDWSLTPLGKIDDWPITLKITLSNILFSKIPKFLYWTQDLYSFYNDAYAELGLAKSHHESLGKSVQTEWGERWSFGKENTMRIFAGKESSWYEDVMVPSMRNGQKEDTYWTLSHHAIYNTEGWIEGVQATILPTTQKVKSINELNQSIHRFRDMVTKAPFLMCLLHSQELEVELVNEKMLQVFDKRFENVQGKKLSEISPQINRILSPIFKKVFAEGEQFNGADFPMEIMRSTGSEIGYFDFIFYPMKNTSGAVEDILIIATDVSEAKKSRDIIAESEKRYKFLADSMPQFVWSSPASGQLDYFNKATIEYTGFSYEDLKNNWIEVVHPHDREKNIALWSKSIADGTPFHIEHRFKNTAGDYRWMLSRATPQLDENGKIVMWVGTSTDIDEIKRHELQKNDFIKMANHELKTPVTTIKGYVQLLTKTHAAGSDVILSTSLKTINSQVNKLNNLIEDLLDISRIESGSLPLNKHRVDIQKICEESIADINALNQSHKIYLYNLSSEPIYVHADPDRLHQVFANLFTNAVKYSPGKNEINIRIGSNDQNVIVSVSDSGIGIDKEFHPFIFERFYRVPGKAEKTFPGFGIGLYIASEILRRHNGQIWFESEPGKGSTFYFSLPTIK